MTSLPQTLDGRKLTKAYVALALARKLTKSYIDDRSEETNFEPLVRVLDVTQSLLDEIMNEVFPESTLVPVSLRDSEFVM